MEKFFNVLENLTYGNAEEIAKEMSDESIILVAKSKKALEYAKEFQKSFNELTTTKLFHDDNDMMWKAVNYMCNGIDAEIETSFNNYILAKMQVALAKACFEWLSIARANGIDV